MDDLFQTQFISEKIKVAYNRLGKDMESYFKSYVESHIEGKCRNEGYIRIGSSKVFHYSSGLLQGSDVYFTVIFEVQCCTPYEDMTLTCIVKNINKIGIRCIIQEDENPMNVFISSEHNSQLEMDKYKEGDSVQVKVLGHRYELNDTFISIIAEII
jgi:DNA-directed RNA polymerase subunit E'/Rpb7